MYENIILSRGDLVYVDFGKQEGCLQSGIRPAIIVSNNACNKYSPIVHVVPLTSKNKRKLPTHVDIVHVRLKEVSVALVEQLTSINKDQILNNIGSISNFILNKIDNAIEIQFPKLHTEEKIEIDYDYIEKMIYLINEADKKYNEYKDGYFLVSKKSTEKTLEMYCNKYKINYNKIVQGNILENLVC